MPAAHDACVRNIAEACVSGMGDVLWDYDAERDARSGFADPYQVAVDAVVSALLEFETILQPSDVYTPSLRLEYQHLVGRLHEPQDDDQIVSSLISDAAWTYEGACAILRLAKDYGTSVLRNALALAEALDIVDGEAGL